MKNRRYRSESWWNDPENPGMTALYLERFLNYGLTPEELQSGRPIIGIAQCGSDITPCNRIHLQTVARIADGVRDAGGLPLVFPMHPLQESIRRPTAALDRNLAYLGLVEILHGYPLDGVVFTTGCDKTTPAAIMAAATTDVPSLIFNGGPMINSYLDGQPAGAGTVTWRARQLRAAGEIDDAQFLQMLAGAAPSPGHCNTMGTALSMNCLAEAMGMALPGTASIPAPWRERGQMAHATGKAVVRLVEEDLRPSRILTRAALLNAIRVNTAIGGSTNCPPHLIAIARHAGIELDMQDWETEGYALPLLVNCQPAGKYLGEDFHRAGGLPVVLRELLTAGHLDGSALTVTGRTLGENVAAAPFPDGEIIKPFNAPLRERAGFLVLQSNLFDSALIKTSVISENFRLRYLSAPGAEDTFECRAVVFDGPEDYHARINDASLGIDEHTMLVVRGCGVIGFPASGEVVNMQPPDALLRAGITELPTLGDGRQSGTSASPSILNASPESAAGGGLSRLRTGDRVRVDLRARRVDAIVSEEEWQRRALDVPPAPPATATPWQQLYRAHVGQLDTGGCFDFACAYRGVCHTVPRHNH
ncbi:Dihydroxy-acid dehydratase [Chthoniobacter flavus Ellin428]|uniref:Dihydroxy-acid dehydratase n=1 Tax=Chthoniobacter flavus Ellin428 TaxID=497964 RepID=B4D7J9_9BACT|nr:IlvD/Edd family dehydratase [Chthoniobacter flavus]EDY17616.1 Dihydroxy-acid dehydratase [Chthoniobacter flavus Ellin428]TCO92355.1 dihydroxy-acid dehydratase [Chthoniobacter flavus]